MDRNEIQEFRHFTQEINQSVPKTSKLIVPYRLIATYGYKEINGIIRSQHLELENRFFEGMHLHP